MKVKLQVLVEDSRVGYEVGDEVILECIVRGSPEPSSISWTKTNNENSTWEHMIEIHHHNDSLRKIFMKIESIDIEDFGEYICSAENIYSSISKKIEIYRKCFFIKVLICKLNRPVFRTNPFGTMLTFTGGKVLKLNEVFKMHYSIECNFKHVFIQVYAEYFVINLYIMKNENIKKY